MTFSRNLTTESSFRRTPPFLAVEISGWDSYSGELEAKKKSSYYLISSSLFWSMTLGVNSCDYKFNFWCLWQSCNLLWLLMYTWDDVSFVIWKFILLAIDYLSDVFSDKKLQSSLITLLSKFIGLICCSSSDLKVQARLGFQVDKFLGMIASFWSWWVISLFLDPNEF